MISNDSLGNYFHDNLEDIDTHASSFLLNETTGGPEQEVSTGLPPPRPHYPDFDDPDFNLTLLSDDIWSGLNSSSSGESDNDDFYLNGTTAGGGNIEDSVSVSVVTTGIGLYILSFITFVGNAMVLHAIRTEKRLQTVRSKR